jgi:transposase
MSIRHIANEINVDKNTILLSKRRIEETRIILEESDNVGILNLMR